MKVHLFTICFFKYYFCSSSLFNYSPTLFGYLDTLDCPSLGAGDGVLLLRVAHLILATILSVLIMNSFCKETQLTHLVSKKVVEYEQN